MKCSCLGKALILCQRTSYINIEQSLPFVILHRHPLHNVMLGSKWNVCTFTSNEHFQKFYFWVEQVLFPPIQNEMAHQMVQIQCNNEDRNVESEQNSEPKKVPTTTSLYVVIQLTDFQKILTIPEDLSTTKKNLYSSSFQLYYIVGIKNPS